MSGKHRFHLEYLQVPVCHCYGGSMKQRIFFRLAIHALLWSPYGIGQTIIYLPCGFFFLSSFLFLA